MLLRVSVGCDLGGFGFYEIEGFGEVVDRENRQLYVSLFWAVREEIAFCRTLLALNLLHQFFPASLNAGLCVLLAILTILILSKSLSVLSLFCYLLDIECFPDLFVLIEEALDRLCLVEHDALEHIPSELFPHHAGNSLLLHDNGIHQYIPLFLHLL